MKQTGRVRLLVVLIVLASALFVLMVRTRPSVDNEMIEIARNRQHTPLVEIDKPARLQRDVEAENRRQAEQLYPYLVEKLSSDYEFISVVATSVTDMISDSQVKEVSDTVLAELDSRLADRDAQLDTRFDRVSAELIQKMEAGDESVRAYIPQVVDAAIPQVVEKVLESIEQDREQIQASLQAKMEPVIGQMIAESGHLTSEEAMQTLYPELEKSLVSETVNRVLAEMETRMASMAEAEENKPAVSVPEQPEAPVVEKKPVVEREPSAPVIQQKPVVVKQEPIEAPVFDHLIDPAEYAEKRQQIRQQQIDKVLQRIGS